MGLLFMRILVTGAAGYIGSNLCGLLKGAGHEVLGLDAFNDYYSVAIKRSNEAALRDLGIGVWDMDLACDGLTSAFEGIDAVVHLAAQPGISSRTPWEDYNRNNVVATHRLLEAAISAGVSRMVNVSSSSVYGLQATDSEESEPKPASWYGETKLAAELEIMGAYRLSGFSACSLRLFSVFGERERPEKLFPLLIRAIANDEAFPLYEGSLEHRRSFTYIGDICEGILAVLTNWDKSEGQIFNLGTDQCFTTGEAIGAVEKVMGKRAKIKRTPARLGDQAATHANIDKIRSILGWKPRTGLQEGVEKMVAWYMNEVHGKVDWR